MDGTEPQIPRKVGIQKFIAGFGYALEGLAYAFRTQCNVRVHIAIATVAIIAGLLLKLPRVEMVLVILLVTLVLAAELFNTAIETCIDLVSPDFHPLAKTTKDVSAAAVLVLSIGAVIIGLFIYLPATLQAFDR